MKNIEAKLDEAFRETILLPSENTISGFLTDVLRSKYQFREDDRKIEVISVYYHASSPLSALFALPNYEYYSPDKTVRIAELHLKEHGFNDYSYADIQELCKQVLDENNINYSAHLDGNGLPDVSNYWENQFVLEIDFLTKCWKKAKEQSRSKILGFLESADSGSGLYDLDNGYHLPFDVDLDEYLKNQGFRFEKEM